MNNEENNFNFKDKEIEKITSEITKASKHQLGESFQDAIARGKEAPAMEVMPSSPSESSVRPTPAIPVTPVTMPDVKTEPEEKVPSITPLQTYERDIAEAIRSSSASVASINLAQQKRMQEQKPAARTEKIARKSLTVLISLVLIISAIGISTLVYYFVINRPEAIIPKTPSIITADDVRNIDVTGLKVAAFTEKIRSEIQTATDGKIVLLNFTEQVTDAAGMKSAKNISAVTFFEFFALSSPPTLGRALGEKWVFGFQKTATTPAPFLFMSVASFDNAFEGMHRWEEKMAGNLSPIFFIPEIKSEAINVPTENIGNNPSATTTSTTATTSTTTTATTNVNEFATTNIFEDKIIRSKDVRVLKNTAGKIILLYSFLDQKNLVITTNEKTFGELLDRFFSSQIVR